MDGVLKPFLLNECKTEAVVISAAHNRKCVQPPVDLVIDVCGCTVNPKPCIRDISFVFHDTISMAAHIRRVCQFAYCHIHRVCEVSYCHIRRVCQFAYCHRHRVCEVSYCHIRRVCQVAYCHIRSIATIRKCLSTTACKAIINNLWHSFLIFNIC